MIDDLALRMFARRCELDGVPGDAVAEAWADDGVRAFWRAEADFVLACITEGAA